MGGGEREQDKELHRAQWEDRRSEKRRAKDSPPRAPVRRLHCGVAIGALAQ